MCNLFELSRTPRARDLAAALGVDAGEFLYRSPARPTDLISVVRERDGRRRVERAVWHLVLDERSHRPVARRFSANTRADRLSDPGYPEAFESWRRSRCVVPATSFTESLGAGLGVYHRIELEGAAIAFGGLCREYVHPETGRVTLGASIITLGPLPEWRGIHRGASPLMLPPEPGLIGRWLDRDDADVAAFDGLLVPRLRVPQLATRSARYHRFEPLGEPVRIAPGRRSPRP